ncbi:unnamed protein product [Paramecium sonneborni]|uniref:Transmembrane protein n=1 Tax=Paramecium sonneborni TaxID=65129 RepID=A0A8S1L265_9CILI|nr:unnamed protein product [Paramecium sonneborni]
MKKQVKSTDFDAVIQKLNIHCKTNIDDYLDPLQKIKNSSPMIFGDYCNSNMPIQLQLSPIDTNQKSYISLLSDNIEFSVKDKKQGNNSYQSFEQPQLRIPDSIKCFVYKEKIVNEEQSILNKRLKEIRHIYVKKLEQLDEQYLHQRLQILEQFEQHLSQKSPKKMKEQPLKSALKKKDSACSSRYYTQNINDSQEDDWKFIRDAQNILKKQKSSYDEEFITPSKVRFMIHFKYYNLEIDKVIVLLFNIMNILKVLLLVFLIFTVVTAQQLRGNNDQTDTSQEVKKCSCGSGKTTTSGQGQNKVSLLQYQEALKKLREGIQEASSDFQAKDI